MKPFATAYEIHASLNIFFDLAVLLASLPMCLRLDRARREQWAVAGLCFVGSWILVFSVWRLITIVTHQAGWKPEMDFTWYAPISIIVSCLEVDTAIIAASMPVCWPQLQKYFPAIFVTHVVEITTERRNSNGELELERADSRESRRSLQPKNYSATYDEYYGEAYTTEQVYPQKLDESLHSSHHVQPVEH
jgi:hypothetical protein